MIYCFDCDCYGCTGECQVSYSIPTRNKTMNDKHEQLAETLLTAFRFNHSMELIKAVSLLLDIVPGNSKITAIKNVMINEYFQ